MTTENYWDRLKTAVTALGWSWHEFEPGKVSIQKDFEQVSYFVVAYAQSFVTDIREQADGFDEDKWITEWVRDKLNGSKFVPSYRQLLTYAGSIQSELFKLQYAVAAVPMKDDCKLV